MPALARLPAEVSIVTLTPVLPTPNTWRACVNSWGISQGLPLFILSCGGRRNSTPASEKMQKWKFVDLITLLSNHLPIEEPSTIKVNGQTLIVNPLDHQSKKHKVKLDIHSWMQAYSTYTAALTPVEETAKPELAGLLAHI